MPIKPLLIMGNSQLLEKAMPIEHFNTTELQAIIQDMEDTMLHFNGVGIAAPQIGYSLRIIIFGFDHNPRYPNEKPISKTILINPQITPLSQEKIDGWEGCLSVPGLRGKVARYRSIHYSGFMPDGTFIEKNCEDFHARVVQHEYDHLEGILYPQKISDMTAFGFESELAEQIHSSCTPEV